VIPADSSGEVNRQSGSAGAGVAVSVMPPCRRGRTNALAASEAVVQLHHDVSFSMVILVIWTKSPVRAAGPISAPMACHPFAFQ